MTDDEPTDDKAGRRDEPEPRRPGGKTKLGASKRLPTKKAIKKAAKK